MIRWLRGLSRTDAFEPGTAIFPNIDGDRIAARLRLEREGKKRGENNLPETDAVDLDIVEHKIIERVDEHRRAGLEEFHEHEKVYHDRIHSRSTGAGIRNAANTAETDFQKEISDWKDMLADARSNLEIMKREFKNFRENNQIERTAHEGRGFMAWLAVVLLIIFLESVLNGFFFAGAHEMGVAGGISNAFAISVINIGAASAAGYFIRNLNHIRSYRKVAGITALLSGIAFAAFFNLLVAHFRDAATRVDWDKALGNAFEHILSGNLSLESLDAGLLGLLGLLFALFAGWKAYAADDPYPGYGQVWRKMRDAREDYSDLKREANDTLIETRDKAVDDLNNACSNVGEKITDAARAAEELQSLRHQLNPFLEQCNQKANLLLTIYRDTNKQWRSTPPPKYFSEVFQFKSSVPKPTEPIPNDLPQEQHNVLVREAIDRIHCSCKEAIDSFSAENGDNGDI